MITKNNYYLGFDMGTSSTGWAVTNNNYNLLRAKGKDLWGVRLFKEAETSEKRRSHRTARRMRQRSVARIGLLKELFADEINKIDASFFIRLDESKYHLEDKSEDSRFVIFNDNNFNDKDYFQNYPTIFHLRKDLIECTSPKDVRLVFLSLLSIYKRRGHFLNSNLDVQKNSDLFNLLESFISIVSNYCDLSFNSIINYKNIELALSDSSMSRSKKSEKILELLEIKKTDDKVFNEMIKTMCGLTFDVRKIFSNISFELESTELVTSFNDPDFHEKYDRIIDLLDDDNMELLEILKSIHDQSLLANVMQGCNYLSDARVRLYNKHHDDLVLIKMVIKKYARNHYDAIFRSDDDGSYSAYIGSVNSRKKIRRGMKKRKVEDLYSTLRKILKSCPQDDLEVKYILNQIESENFLPKQLTFANSVIPHQLHLDELKVILNNASKYLTFLDETDDTGLSVKDKIVQIYNFQIPYFIGPLNNYHGDKGGNAWALRNSNDRVYPWNFHKVIDVEKSSAKFIEKLIRKCTYISDEKVLAKSSLLYQKYMVLNELNNLRIRGEKPSVKLKQKIFNDLFLQGKKLTQKKLLAYLYSNGVVKKDEVNLISGIDKDFVNSLSTFGKFHGIFGDRLFDDKIKEMVERIVLLGTIYSNDPSYFKEILKRDFGAEINDYQISRISGFKFNDWGKLSKQFLEMEGVNKSTGEVLSLIQMMWDTNDNLMEILSNRYTFAFTLEQNYKDIVSSLGELDYHDLEGYYLSSPVKRMVWQTLLVTKEIVTTLNHHPKRIFIEMARENGEKGQRTISRKMKLLNLYNNCKSEARDWCNEIKSLDESKLNSKKLYLYYTQKGRCMYSGEVIEIQELFNDNLYDIDHIYPRRYVKDDSLENNLVLVKKQLNSDKGDVYPISEKFQKDQNSFWKSLLAKDMKDGFISLEKYRRLINRNPLSDEQLAQFVSRQLVETRQGTKVVTQILKQSLPNSEIVFIKAKNISDFRKDFNIPKTRIINDFHHAHDAYLSIVVGNAYHVKFTNNPINFFKQMRSSQENSFHMNKLFLFDVSRGDDIAWIAANESTTGTIKTIRVTLTKNSPLITKMTYQAHGKLFNATICGSSQAKPTSYAPLKSSEPIFGDVEKYGGYKNVSIAYLFLVEHGHEKKRIRTLEALPIMYANAVENDANKLVEYCVNNLKLNNPSIRLLKIKIQSLVKRDGFFLNITGKTNERLTVDNGHPLIVSNNWVSYIKKIEKTLSSGFLDKDVTNENNIELYTLLFDKHLNSIYSKRPNPITNTLRFGKEKFVHLNTIDQCLVISQILQISQLSNKGANLELIGGSKESGKSYISKNISNAKEFKLVNQSVLGIFNNEIDLLKV